MNAAQLAIAAAKHQAALAGLQPVTLVIGGNTFTASGGTFRTATVQDEQGGFWEKRSMRVRVLKSALDAVSVTVRANATDCTVDGVSCKITDVAQPTGDLALTLTCEAV